MKQFIDKERYALSDIDHIIDNADVLIFDLDGTIVETDYANFLAYSSAISQITKHSILNEYSKGSRFTRNSILDVIPHLTTCVVDEIVKLKESIYNNYLNETIPNDFLVGILDNYSSSKILVLATNSREDRAMSILNYYSLSNKFNNKYFRNHMVENKFEYVLTDMQIMPNRVVVIENDDNEIENAVLAGISCDYIIKIS